MSKVLAGHWVKEKITKVEEQLGAKHNLEDKKDILDTYSLVFLGATEILNAIKQENELVNQGADYINTTLESIEKRIALNNALQSAKD